MLIFPVRDWRLSPPLRTELTGAGRAHSAAPRQTGPGQDRPLGASSAKGSSILTAARLAIMPWSEIRRCFLLRQNEPFTFELPSGLASQDSNKPHAEIPEPDICGNPEWFLPDLLLQGALPMP